ncbi:drebrin-like protein [Anoplophora glabripennis]|nr:drebrin-like protein [Anoplophora glabripennis]
MSLDLSKNNASLQNAWKDVLNEKSKTNWALFGYEGQTNSLKVVSTGCEGIEELREDLNSGKIMYAFVKMTDPKTSLDKYVLINWQGEGANTVRKGMCANHLRDIEKFFRGAHLTINARNEDEVEPELIIENLKKGGSEYRFKVKPEIIEPVAPVGTTYQRVNPVKEINSQERDQFWRKEEEEERKRLDEEKKKKQSEIYKLELEIAQREEKETKMREEQTLIRNNTIDQIRQSEKQIAIESGKEFTSKIPEKPVRNSILKSQQIINEVSELSVENNMYNKIDNTSDDENNQFSTIKRSPKDNIKNSPASTPVEKSSSQENKGDVLENVEQITDQQFVDEYIYGLGNPLFRARALYDYQAADDTEISFDPGDIITNIEQVDEGWWQGLAPDGITYGLFPANYVELIEQ